MAEQTQNTNESTSRPSYHILICLVEIWPFKDGDDPMAEPSNPTLFAEVESINIEDTYRKTICGASVKFPRGTILRRTITPENGLIYDTNMSASIGKDGVLTEMRNRNARKKNDNGEWEEIEGAKLAEVKDFQVGDRIRIWLGYTTDPEVVELTNYRKDQRTIYSSNEALNEYKNNLFLMFNGYITEVSLDTPIELECENLASKLKMISCPKRKGKASDTVNTFLGEEKGCLNLLKGTGLSIYPNSKNINLGKIDLTDDLVMADLFDIWGQREVYAFVKMYNGKPTIAVGRSYFSDAKTDSILKLNETSSVAPLIEFDYHVANNDLTLMKTDIKYIGVEAQCLEQKEGKDKFYKITVIRNPQYDPKDPKSKQYRTVNETKLSKKAVKLGKHLLTTSKEKVDLSKYTIIPYMSSKIDISHEDLMEEAIKYLETYNPNGIDGSLTLFGDLHLTTGTKVELKDDLHSGKNGYYFIDEVNTEFGTNGYRQKIQLPYCISRKNEQSE